MIPSILPLDPPLKVYMCGEMDWLKNGMTYVVLPSANASECLYTVDIRFWHIDCRRGSSIGGGDQVTDGEGRVEGSWDDVMVDAFAVHSLCTSTSQLR